MKTVLYGEHDAKRLQRESELVRAAHNQQLTLVALDVFKLDPKRVEEELGTTSLFGAQRLIRIQRLEKMRSSKQAQQLVATLTDSAEDILVVIEGKLTPTKKKLFGSEWKLEEFSMPAVIFQFLESIRIKPLPKVISLYKTSLTDGSEWGLHYLLQRQFRLLLAAKTGAPIAGPPFLKKKLQAQANKFSETELSQLLFDLFTIERSIKSGNNALSWDQRFAMILVKLYQGEQ